MYLTSKTVISFYPKFLPEQVLYAMVMGAGVICAMMSHYTCMATSTCTSGVNLHNSYRSPRLTVNIEKIEF